MAERILVVEDDVQLRELLEDVFARHGYSVASAGSAEDALRMVKHFDRVDALITDRVLPGMSGDALLQELRTLRPEINVIVITAFGSIDSAVALIRAGAFDYVTKPFSNEQIIDAARRALLESAERRALVEASRLRIDQIIPGFVGRSAAAKDLAAFVARAGRSQHPVLISGETGTGKELVARGIHAVSHRGPFVAVNCGALPEQLLESELFGHEKGAFTGADRAKSGLLQTANGGTVFLDEIGEMPLQLQPKLLRALESGEVRPVGSTATARLDFRLVCATNRDLEKGVAEGSFRSDLFWRINVLQVTVPPLRDRPEDIPLLAEYFRREAAGDEPQRAQRIDQESLAILRTYPWPGNVRELRNAIHQAVFLAPGTEIRPEDLPARIRETDIIGDATADAAHRHLSLKELERRYILEVLREVDGNKSRAAAILGISRRTIHRKLGEYEATDDEHAV